MVALRAVILVSGLDQSTLVIILVMDAAGGTGDAGEPVVPVFVMLVVKGEGFAKRALDCFQAAMVIMECGGLALGVGDAKQAAVAGVGFGAAVGVGKPPVVMVVFELHRCVT